MTPQQLKTASANSAYAFRGYNVTNLGRSRELLVHAAYGPTVRKWLVEAEQLSSDILARPINLVERVEAGQEADLDSYADAISLIVAMEQAQLELLSQHFGIEFSDARFAFGYSLGEISALISADVLPLASALHVPLSLSDDCVSLAENVTLAAFFSKTEVLPLDVVRRLCVRINSEGLGVIGISAYLSPNSVLLMGQQNTIGRFKELMKDEFEFKVYLRRNDNQWPPLHTPIVWSKNIPNRAAVTMMSMEGGFSVPHPPIISMVTGKASYNDFNAREILHAWVDHPQRLWDVVYETLQAGIETIVHVGPQPNIIPATYRRLCDNVEAQTRGRIGMKTLARMVHRPWLKNILPQRASLLRAPLINQVILEDWLLEQTVP